MGPQGEERRLDEVDWYYLVLYETLSLSFGEFRCCSGIVAGASGLPTLTRDACGSLEPLPSWASIPVS